MGELGERNMVLEHVFNQYDKHGKGELAPHALQSLHGDIRMGGISYPQVLASMKYICSARDTCSLNELHDLLQEMDRRYFLMQDLRWEFSLLDREQRDTITDDQARWMVQAVHGKNFSRRKWGDFLRKRAVPGSRVSLPEIEVLLCNVKSSLDVIYDKEEEERERQERLRKEQHAQEEAERLRKLKEDEKRRRDEEVQRFLETLRKTPIQQPTFVESDEDGSDSERGSKKKVEKYRIEDEARRKMIEEENERRNELQRKEEEARRKEEERLRELEKRHRDEEERRRREDEEKYKDSETILEDAERQEKELEEALKRIRQKKKETKDEKKRGELQLEEDKLLKLLREMKHKRIRYRLKVAIKDKDKYKLEYTINEFQTEKVEDVDMELEKAKRLLLEITSRDNLRKAMSRRQLEDLEKAISVIKKNGLEVQLAQELIEASVILVRLRKIQRIRAEILELKQSTVAEIRSYQNPPPVVHTVMTATFLILGHSEKETKVPEEYPWNWKTVQALVGKTGKEGLKRRCLECDASKISMESAKRAKHLLDKHELDEVRDVSAGAATFYVFSVAMVDECFDIAENGPMPAESTGPMKPKIDPSTMKISRSKQMVKSSTTVRQRSKTPPARRK